MIEAGYLLRKKNILFRSVLAGFNRPDKTELRLFLASTD